MLTPEQLAKIKERYMRINQCPAQGDMSACHAMDIDLAEAQANNHMATQAIEELAAERDQWKERSLKQLSDAEINLKICRRERDRLKLMFEAEQNEHLERSEECENWKARAEALERAVKAYVPCETCVSEFECRTQGKAVACSLAGFKPDAWQFDTVRFGAAAEPDHIVDANEMIKSGWVACSERLPEEADYYLVWGALGYYLARYFNGRWMIGDGGELAKVYHWRYLPPPPEATE